MNAGEVFNHTDYRVFLKDVLVEKIRKNAAFSLRAFAAQLGVAPGMLSDVLNHKKNLSVAKAMQVASGLRLQGDEDTYFQALVLLENTRRPGQMEQREKVLERLQTLRPASLNTVRTVTDLSVDHFHSVANWICVAGFALLGCAANGFSAAQIAARLSVSKFEAEDAMERWVRLDLVERDGEGRYFKRSDAHLMMKSQAPQGALRKFHATMLEKASEALVSQSNLEKFVGSETLAFDASDLREVSEILEGAISKVLAKAKSGKKKADVYHLGFQFFRVNKKGESK